MRLQTPCPICQKPLEQVSQEQIGIEVLTLYRCGHAFTKEQVEIKNSLFLESLDGTMKARPYQAEGVEFIMKSDYCCILGDQMRLGKTNQSLWAVRNHPDFGKEDFSALCLVRAANIYQWVREIKRWAYNLPDSVWVIQGTKNWIPPGFKFYVCSMDTFGRKGMSDKLLEYGFKVCIVDECHSFKNADTQRSQSLVAFLKNIERSTLEQEIEFSCPFCKERWNETVTIQVSTLEANKRTSKTSHCPNCFAQVQQSAAAHIKVKRNCGVVMLSGNVIKNRADEFFIPLNICAPELFPSLQGFRRQYLQQDEKGRWSRLSPFAAKRFKELIKPFYLRREKEDIYTELPKVNRNFNIIEVTSKRLADMYNRVLDDLEAKHPSGDFSYFQDIGELQRLRQITGLAKTEYVADYAQEFLDSTEKGKLAIGVHHHSVRDELRLQLSQFGVTTVDGTSSNSQKDWLNYTFKEGAGFQNSQNQVLILGIPAAKEGMELPYIENVIVVEREFTPVDETQFEYRFYNPDPDYLKQRGLENKVTTYEYILADKTIDKFMHDLNVEKSHNVGSTIGTHWSIDQDPVAFRELMQTVISNRLKVA